ncbi:MAG: murein biosynthesis integral membrane protein MurJ [Clostridia bacterium]|nr:murein biosynthesis integral membrane protein MurJ [Clostridia bacterium]
MERLEKKKLLSTAAALACIIVLAKVLGLIRDTLVAGIYGTTDAAVAFDTAAQLPTLVFDLLVGSAITAAFIPVFNRILVQRGRAEADRFAASYINLAFLISTALALLGYAAAGVLVRLIAPSLDTETAALASSLFRIMLPVIPLASLAFLFVGILQSLGSFRVPAAISIVSAVLTIVYLLFFSSRFGITGLAVVTAIGWLGQAAVQIPMLRRLGYRHAFCLSLRRDELRESLRTALPMLVSAWTVPLATLADTRFASAVEGGRAITALGYANKIYFLLGGVLAFVTTNLIFPRLSRAAAGGDEETARELLSSSGKLLLFFSAPVAAGVSVLAGPIVACLFEHGEFTANDTALTAAALSVLALGVICTALNELLTKALIAAGRPVFPMIASVASLLVNFSLAAVLTPRCGIAGIAAAIAAAAVLSLVLLLAAALRRRLLVPGKGDIADALKAIGSAALAGGAVFLLRSAVTAGFPRWLDLVVCLTAGVVLYFGLTALCRSGVYPLLRDALGKEGDA